MRKKKKGTTVFLVVMLLVGLSVMLYPTFSNWWNSKTQSRAIAAYDDIVRNLDPETYDEIFNKASDYNRRLLAQPAPFANYKYVDGYNDALNISGTGIMGYVTIPVINVELPIYHGTGEDVLNIAAGHLEGSSLPIGGMNTHSVISAHRGLPSARLFTDLDQLVEGDQFTITVLDRVLTYEVEEVLTVRPEQMDALAVIPDSDYVTLMTCTPYGINTHRMLVRSKRAETITEKDVKIFADMVKIDPMLVIPFVAAPLLIILLAVWTFGGRKVKKSPKEYADYLLSANRKESGSDDGN